MNSYCPYYLQSALPAQLPANDTDCGGKSLEACWNVMKNSVCATAEFKLAKPTNYSAKRAFQQLQKDAFDSTPMP
jgi:hypothetical protein